MNIFQNLKSKEPEMMSFSEYLDAEAEMNIKKRREALSRGELNSTGYLGTEIEKILYSLGIEWGPIPYKGYNMDESYMVEDNFGVKIPKKKASGIRGILGIQVPAISLLDIVNEINKKCSVTPTNSDPNRNKYHVHYTNRLQGGTIEEIDLYLYDVARNSTEPVIDGLPLRRFSFIKYMDKCKKLDRLGLI